MDKDFSRIVKDGQTFVLVPEDVYEHLRENAEMLADIQAYDEAKGRGEEVFPMELGIELSEAAHAGKSLVPIWRKYRGLSQTALAEASGVNRAYLSEIENLKKPGSLEALKRISAALRIDLDDLV
jgi:DNA-binding XRE family transcriptional regulator